MALLKKPGPCPIVHIAEKGHNTVEVAMKNIIILYIPDPRKEARVCQRLLTALA